jgi:hypothetical protein
MDKPGDTTELEARAEALTRSVADLTGAADRLSKRTRRSEIAIGLTILSFLFDITLTVLLYVGLHNQQSATEAIQAVQANGAIVRQQVLCPLYQLLISSESPQARAKYPRGPAAYDQAFATLHAGQKALDCK